MFDENGQRNPSNDILIDQAFIKDFEINQNELYLINAKQVEIYTIIDKKIVRTDVINETTVKNWDPVRVDGLFNPHQIELNSGCPGILFV